MVPFSAFNVESKTLALDTRHYTSAVVCLCEQSRVKFVMIAEGVGGGAALGFLHCMANSYRELTASHVPSISRRSLVMADVRSAQLHIICICLAVYRFTAAYLHITGTLPIS